MDRVRGWTGEGVRSEDEGREGWDVVLGREGTIKEREDEGERGRTRKIGEGKQGKDCIPDVQQP